MIGGYVGLQGSGKSFCAVVDAIGYWLKGGTVVTNLPLRWEPIKAYVRERYGLELQDCQLVKLDDEQAAEFWIHTPAGTPDMPTLVIIDEAGVIFSVEDRQQRGKEFRSFCAQARHVFVDINFMAQTVSMLDKKIRTQVHKWYSFADLSTFKVFGWGFPWLLVFNRAEYPDPSLRGIPIDRRTYPKDPKIYKLYDSYFHHAQLRMAGTRARVKLEKTVQTGKGFVAMISQKWVSLSVVVVLVLLVVNGARAFRSTFPGKKSVPAQLQEVAERAETPVRVVKLSQREEPLPPPPEPVDRRPVVAGWSGDYEGARTLYLSSGETVKAGEYYEGNRVIMCKGLSILLDSGAVIVCRMETPREHAQRVQGAEASAMGNQTPRRANGLLVMGKGSS